MISAMPVTLQYDLSMVLRYRRADSEWLLPRASEKPEDDAEYW